MEFNSLHITLNVEPYRFKNEFFWDFSFLWSLLYIFFSMYLLDPLLCAQISYSFNGFDISLKGRNDSLYVVTFSSVTNVGLSSFGLRLRVHLVVWYSGHLCSWPSTICFTDGDAKTQEGWASCLKSHGWEGSGLGYESPYIVISPFM